MKTNKPDTMSLICDYIIGAALFFIGSAFFIGMLSMVK